jgi:hypothetical protein
MSEANLKQAFRNLVKAHIAHAASNGSTNRNAATLNARDKFKTALNDYVKGTVTHDMRIRYLLNKHYVTNVNKNYLVSLLKNTNATKDAIKKHLSEKEGYYFGNENRNGKSTIRRSLGVTRIKKLLFAPKSKNNGQRAPPVTNGASGNGAAEAAPPRASLRNKFRTTRNKVAQGFGKIGTRIRGASTSSAGR